MHHEQPDPSGINLIPEGGPTRTGLDCATMSVKQFCEVSSLSKSTAHKLIRTGRLEATTVGTRRLIYVDSVKALLGGASTEGRN